jgi:hypothetical protein
MTQGAMCAKHPMSNAIGPCTRCGSFMCAQCAQGGLCEACRARMPVSEFAPCPSCQQSSATRMGFTWWGGALGPKLFTHVKCGGCGTTYNGKTGKSNNTNIAIYFVVINAIFIAIIIAMNA